MQIGDFHTDDKKCVFIGVHALNPRNVTVSKLNTSDMLCDFYVSEDRAVKEKSRQFEKKCKVAEPPPDIWRAERLVMLFFLNIFPRCPNDRQLGFHEESTSCNFVPEG